MKLVLKIINDSNVPHEKVKNVIYFSINRDYVCFCHNMFKISDYFQFEQFVKLNFNIYVTRMKLNKEQLQEQLYGEQLPENTYLFEYHYHFLPLFPK